MAAVFGCRVRAAGERDRFLCALQTALVGGGEPGAFASPPERGWVAATSRSTHERGGGWDFCLRVPPGEAAAADPARRGTQPRSVCARSRSAVGPFFFLQPSGALVFSEVLRKLAP